MERQITARTPVFYRLDKMENGDSSVGYIRIKEFNALAKKDLVIGGVSVLFLASFYAHYIQVY